MAGSSERARARQPILWATATIAALSILLAGCESTGPDPDPDSASTGLVTPDLPASQIATCAEATASRPLERSRGWRANSTEAGPLVFAGFGRAFAERGEVADEGPVKIPVLMRGSRRVLVEILPRDRARASIGYLGTERRQQRVVFEGCGDGEVAFWAGGLQLADHSRPVAIEVAVDGEAAPRRLLLGRRL